MKKYISLSFDFNGVNEEDSIASFDAIASAAGVMTAHEIIFAPNAFKDAILNLKKDKKNLTMLFNHNENEIIGGFPTDMISEKNGQLIMRGEINLQTQRGLEVYALIKQEVLTDLSVGIMIDPEKDISFNEDIDALQIDRVRELSETSIVFSGSNPAAKVTNFGTVSFQDFPIADDNVEWNKSYAINRIKEFTKSYDSPSVNFKRAFLWLDGNKNSNFYSYKFPFVDVVDGKLKVIPKALFSVIKALNSNMILNIPKSDVSSIKRNINRYLLKMGKKIEFLENKPINEFTIRDCESFLKSDGSLSDKESKQFLSIMKGSSRDADGADNVLERDVLDQLTKSNTLSKLTRNINNVRYRLTD